jgi:hypothetical protein
MSQTLAPNGSRLGFDPSCLRSWAQSDVCAPRVHKLGPETPRGGPPESVCVPESPWALSPVRDCWGFAIDDHIRCLFAICQAPLSLLSIRSDSIMAFRLTRTFQLLDSRLRHFHGYMSIENKILLGFVWQKSQLLLPRLMLGGSTAPPGSSARATWPSCFWCSVLPPNCVRSILGGISRRSGFVLRILLSGSFPGFGPPREYGLTGNLASLFRS